MKLSLKGTAIKRKRPLQNGEALAGILFALPSLSGFALFFIVPFTMSLFYCFTEGIGVCGS
jgi:ABC-type sugar transport system permease subunit